ncbi:hypothetical protein OG333_35915 [Streptomyces anulatus]|uniref:hypothetical protein n=1 Tax=Streptomyces TaxID=1883 RepID=UPI0015CF1455|nr:hypothetical protein [Streptomyces sp. or20]WSV79433.1 hypothetical protein OG333_35915 [Streptomyces anulatus]
MFGGGEVLAAQGVDDEAFVLVRDFGEDRDMAVGGKSDVEDAGGYGRAVDGHHVRHVRGHGRILR